jgi:hypothetical protein
MGLSVAGSCEHGNEHSGWEGADWMGLSVAGSCEHDNEHSGSTKCEFLD